MSATKPRRTRKAARRRAPASYAPDVYGEAAATRRIEVGFLPSQLGAWGHLARGVEEVLYLGGRGTGKTELGAWFIGWRVATCPGATHLVTARDYPQVRDVVVPRLKKRFEALGLAFRFNKTDSLFEFADGSLVLCRSMESYETLRGTEFASWWPDEAALYSEMGVAVVRACLRDYRFGRPLSLFTTTPRGFNWVHKDFVVATNPSRALVRAKTDENVYLPGYADQLARAYRTTPELEAQERCAEFTALSGKRAYRAFDRVRHARPLAYDPRADLFLTFDFNVSPFLGIASHEVMGPRGVETQFFREFALRDAGVADMGRAIRAAFPAHKGRTKIYGDATARGRNVQTGEATWELLRRELLPLRPQLELDASNPPPADRVAVVNWLFGEDLVYVDPSCTFLIGDGEQARWKDDGTLDQKTDKDRTHAGDAAGYQLYARRRPDGFRTDWAELRRLAI